MKKKMGVGCWLLGSIQSEMWTHEREHKKKNKRGVVCILSLFIIEKEEKRRKGKKKEFLQHDRETSGRGQL
jgi:hypothetical protein